MFITPAMVCQSYVTNSFWDKKMTGQATSAGGTAAKAVLMVADVEGYAAEDPDTVLDTTSPDMMSAATYSGWDFANTWVMDEGGTYPHFQFRYPEGVRGVGGHVYMITNDNGVTTEGVAGAGQSVSLYYSNDGVSETNLNYSVGTGASSRYYGVLDKNAVGNTAFVIGKSLNGSSKMEAKSGSVYPLDIWASESHTLTYPIVPTPVVVPPLTNTVPLDTTASTLAGAGNIPVTIPSVGPTIPTVTIVDQSGAGNTNQNFNNFSNIIGGLSSVPVTNPIVIPQPVTPPVSAPSQSPEVSPTPQNHTEDTLGGANVSFVAEPPPGREPVPVTNDGGTASSGSVGIKSSESKGSAETPASDGKGSSETKSSDEKGAVKKESSNEKSEASSEKEVAAPSKGDGKAANWRDVPITGFTGNEDAKKFLTDVRVIEGAVYVIDGGNAMSLLGMGDSMRVFYKKRKGSTAGLRATTKKSQTADNGRQTAAEAEVLKSPVPSEPAMKQALSNLLEKVAAEPEVAPAPEARVLKSATPVVMRQSDDGTRYGTLKNPGKDVFVRSRGGDWKSAKDGMVILPGDEVKTAQGNVAEMMLDGGKVGRVEIKEGSLFRIQQASIDAATGDKTTILDLAIGKILVKVEALKGNGKFEVRTPTALTGVRGTIFEVTVKEKA